MEVIIFLALMCFIFVAAEVFAEALLLFLKIVVMLLVCIGKKLMSISFDITTWIINKLCTHN